MTNKKNVPAIRFAGFSESWEQRKFGDLGSVAMCKRIFKEQTADEGEIPFYKIGTFGGEPDAFITRELFEEYKAKFSYPEIGDMLISASGTIGRIVEYTGKDEYFQDSNIVWFKHDERIDNSFLKCLYSIVEWAGIEGSTIKRLYNDNFLKTEFMLPSIEEQCKIGTFFSHLDTLITLHQRKCKIYNLLIYIISNFPNPVKICMTFVCVQETLAKESEGMSQKFFNQFKTCGEMDIMRYFVAFSHSFLDFCGTELLMFFCLFWK